MSSSEPNDNKRVLYLEQIDIEPATKKERVELQIDDNDVEIHRNKKTYTWIPSRSLELVDKSKITLVVKSGLLSLTRWEITVQISGQEATEAFWRSMNSISREVRCDQQPTTVTFKFRPSPTAETTRKVVQELEAAMENYRVLMSKSTEKKIDLVFKHGAKLAEFNPIASAAFHIASSAFEVLKEQKKYDDKVRELAEWIKQILPFATLSLEEIVCDETELLDRAVEKMCTLVLDTANFICEYSKQNPAVRAVKGVATDAHAKIKEFQEDFVKLKEDFDRAVNVETLKLVRKTEELRLLNQLKPVDAAGYQEDRTCMEGTRNAVLNDVIAWALDPNAPSIGSNADNIYWVYGSPGLGKTSVANSLCERLHRSRNLGGSFFCRRDDPILRQPRRVLPTLISKLAEMWSPYRRLVAQALEDDPQLNPDSAHGEVLLELLQSVQKHPPGTLVLVVDALDECGEPSTRKPLLKSLLDACFQVPWLKVIVTSRPEHDIETFFQTRLVTHRNLAIDDQTREDIALFTRNSMTLVAQRRNLENWPGEERLKQIVERSGGLFMFVETLRRFVDQINPKPLLAQVLDGDLKDANAELYKLYSATITTRIGSYMDAFRSLARAIVVVAKYRPLCDDTLASLLMLEQSMVRTLIDELSPLLYRDQDEKNGVRVRHSSVTEFLTGPACPSEFRVDLQQANAELGLRCLATMTKELKFNICDLETSLLANADVQSLERRVDLKIRDLLQYSCIHWSSHLCADSDPASAEVSALLDGFFTGPRPLYWIEVMSLMGKVSLAISALRQIKASIQKFQNRHHEPFNDVMRFLLAFRTPISTSTPHIYISALPFTPKESTLWKNANQSFPKAMNACKGRMQSWPTLQGAWQGHTSGVRSIAYSRDGRYVVSGSDDNTIRMWDTETGETVGEPWRGHTGIIHGIAYSPDGRRVVSGSGDGTIRMWDAETGEAVGEPWRGHADNIYSVAYSPDGRRVVSGSQDRTIRFWDAERGEATGEPVKGHTGSIRSVTYSPDGRRVISGSEDMTIRMWDAKTGEAVGEPWVGYTGTINSIACSPDDRHVVSGSGSGPIRFWDAETGEAVGEPLRGRRIHSVAYSPDGRHVVSGSEDSTIRIWDVETGEAVGEPLRGHTDWIRSVAYSPDGRRIVSGSDDTTIRMWDAETGEAVGESLKGYTDWIRSVAYSPDGRRVVSGSDDNTIRMWDAENGEAVGETWGGHTGRVYAVTYSPTGRRVVSGSRDRTIRMWDAETGNAVGRPLGGHTGIIYSVAYSPDGQRVVSGSQDKTIRMWDAKTGEAVGEPFKGHTNEINSVAYSPDGRRVISSSGDTTIRMWDAETGEAVGEPWEAHTGIIYSVAYSPDGQRVVSGSQDKTIRIWDAKTGQAVGEPFKGHTNEINSVAYSPDGRRVVSGSDDSTIRIWDVETGEAVGEPLRGHTRSVLSVAYSPDGRRVVSGSSDNTIRIWDVTTGGNNAALFGHIVSPDMLGLDGYVRDTQGLLFWVPEDCRNGLTCLAITAIPTMGRQRVVQVDLTDFQYGTSWANVYVGGVQSQAVVTTSSSYPWIIDSLVQVFQSVMSALHFRFSKDVPPHAHHAPAAGGLILPP